jgi:endoglucanase
MIIRRSVVLALAILLSASCDEDPSRHDFTQSDGEPAVKSDGGSTPPAPDSGAPPQGDTLQAPDASVWPAPAEQIKRLGHGINLGNMLEAPNEGEWGAKVKQHYLKTIADAGFESVRVPIRWSNHAASAAPYTIDASFAARVDEVVGWALAQNLAVIINIHHYEELQKNPAGHKARLLALWQQIAARFKDASPRLMFELLNEPHDSLTSKLWNSTLVEALAVVRKTNPNRTVLVGPGSWNSIGSLKDLVLPADDNLIVTVHFYSPFWFTHSGASWAGNQPAGAKWNGDQPQQDELRKELQVASDWSTKNKIPIHVGEFGAYEKADQASRPKWTAFVVKELNKRGFAWSYWEFCSGFGAYDPQAEAWRQELLNALNP